jgi:hypothetical protein
LAPAALPMVQAVGDQVFGQQFSRLPARNQKRCMAANRALFERPAGAVVFSAAFRMWKTASRRYDDYARSKSLSFGEVSWKLECRTDHS